MKLENKTVCITGAAGFVGPYLIPRLLQRGARVVAVDNFDAGGADRLIPFADRIEIVTADVREITGLEAALRKADIVYHLAAIASPYACARDFSKAFEVNVLGAHNVLSLCTGVQRFVFFSTVTVYGQANYLPMDERHPLNGADPYATTKNMGEQLVRTQHYLCGLPYTIVRMSNLFGPGQADSYLIPTLIQQGLTSHRIEIWDPRPIRDFLFVEDAAQALVQIVECEATAGEVVNLGSGQGIATGELADQIARLLGTTWVDVQKPAPFSGKLICDVRRIQALTGWRPMLNLGDGLSRTVEHFKKLLTPASARGGPGAT